MLNTVIPVKRVILSVILVVCSAYAFGQDKGVNSFIYPDIDEGRLFETQWKYTETIHQKSQKSVHRAIGGYENYLYFKLDKTCSIYQNGLLNEEKWSINGPILRLKFRGLDSFIIARLVADNLVLEYHTKSTGDTYEYHFIKSDDKAGLFKSPNYLLPQVVINSDKIKKDKTERNVFERIWNWIFGKDEEKDETPKTFINIEIIGGGFYGGIDPPVKNYIQLKTDGRLIREFESLYNGMVKTQKSISRAEVEEFVEFIDKKGFFNLPSNFDCKDPECFQRLNKKPMPVPFRISVTYGLKHKVINVPIYGKDEKNRIYLEYPAIIDQIAEILNRMANRLN